MTNIFEQYGDCVIFWNTDVQTVEVGEIEPLPKAITLNELAEALEEKLYPKFKERYDGEKRENVCKNLENRKTSYHVGTVIGSFGSSERLDD